MAYAVEDADAILPRIHELANQRRLVLIGPPAETIDLNPALRCSCPQIGGYGEAYRMTVDSCDVHGSRAVAQAQQRAADIGDYG